MYYVTDIFRWLYIFGRYRCLNILFIYLCSLLARNFDILGLLLCGLSCTDLPSFLKPPFSYLFSHSFTITINSFFGFYIFFFFCLFTSKCTLDSTLSIIGLLSVYCLITAVRKPFYKRHNT